MPKNVWIFVSLTVVTVKKGLDDKIGVVSAEYTLSSKFCAKHEMRILVGGTDRSVIVNVQWQTKRSRGKQ